MDKISVVVNTLNEEQNLKRLLASVKDLADEIVVVDMYSDDKTLDIASEYGAKIYPHERLNYVEPARNFAISKANNEWILLVDPDEEISQHLRKKLKEIVKDPQADYFSLPRKNIIFGKWMQHSRWWPDYNIRFFRKGSVSWNEVIHSVPLTVGRGMDLPQKEDFAIIHYHYKNIEEYLNRLNRYTTEHSKLLKKKNVNFEWRNLIIKPAEEFFSRYFYGRGYQDGLHGLVLAGLQAFSEFIVYVKLWQLEDFSDTKIPVRTIISTMKEKEKDLNYWQADTLIDTGAGIVQKIKRRFKLP